MDDHKDLNFIVIISDTLRRDFLGCYGNDWVDTRHIDQFAEKSLVFDQAYSASFPTVPCRRDIFTGCYTASYVPWAPLNEYEPVVQTILGEKYTKMMIVDQHHILENGYHYDRGFDGFEWIRGQEGDRWKTDPPAPPFKCDPSKIRNPERLQRCHMRGRAHWKHESDTFPGRTGTAVCNWLERNYEGSHPFYLYVDFFDPHEPWDPPQWFVDKYDPGYDGDIVDYPLYDKWRDFLTEAELKHCRARYAGEVTLIDRWVGRIFEKVEDLGLWDNTMVIFSTDHGFLLGEHEFIGKSWIRRSEGKQDVLSYLPLFEEINHIPFIVHYPGGKIGRTNAIVQPPDIMPTILDLAGKPTLGAHGLSFKGVLEGHKSTHRDFAVSFPYLKGLGKPISFIKDRHAAIFYSRRSDDAGTGDGLKADKAVDGVSKTMAPWEGARDMLFDLQRDPQQERDLAGERPEILLQFRTQLLDFLEEIGTEDDIITQYKK